MISFEPLFSILEQRSLSLYDLFKNGVCAYSTYKNISENKSVRMSSLKRIAEYLGCDLDGICEWKE